MFLDFGIWIKDVDKALKNDLMDDLGVLIEDTTKKRIVTRNIRGPALAESTVKRRKKNSDIPLFDKGNLKNSITHYTKNKTKLFVGTPLFYAKYHQEGTKDEHIPKREFLFLDDSDEKNIMKVIESTLD